MACFLQHRMAGKFVVQHSWSDLGYDTKKQSFFDQLWRYDFETRWCASQATTMAPTIGLFGRGGQRETLF